jgi:osmotically-inducible protein OsmY
MRLPVLLLLAAFAATAVPLPAVRADETHDRAVAAALERSLRMSHIVRPRRLTVSVAYGVARIQGCVSTLLAKERAAAIARGAPGVHTVIDDIELVVPVRDDAEIEAAAEAAARRTLTRPVEYIHIEVADGVAQLVGFARAPAARDAIVRAVKGIEGVREVRDAITVAPS